MNEISVKGKASIYCDKKEKSGSKRFAFSLGWFLDYNELNLLNLFSDWEVEDSEAFIFLEERQRGF